MRVFKRVTIIFLVSAALIYTLLVALIQTPAMQKFAAEKISGYLEHKTGARVVIGHITVGFLNEIVLSDVELDDMSGEIWLKAKRIAVGFKPLPLLRKKLRLNTCRIAAFEVNLTRDSADAPLNIQYLIDLFSVNDSIKKPDPIDFRAKRLILQNGGFSYREKDADTVVKGFNVKSFKVSGISTDVRFREFSADKVKMDVRNLGFAISGLILNSEVSGLSCSKEKVLINSLKIGFGDSKVAVSDVSFALCDENMQRRPLNEILFHLKIDDSNVIPGDLCDFVPNLSGLNSKIQINGYIKGTMNDISVPSLNIDVDNDIIFNAKAVLRDVFSSNPDDAFVFLEIDKLNFSPIAVSRIINDLNGKQIVLPPQITQMNVVKFSGDVSASTDYAVANGIFNTDAGSFSVKLEAGKNGTDFIRGRIVSDKLEIGSIIADNRFGDVTFDLNVSAVQRSGKLTAGSVEGIINHFQYNGYNYENIVLNGKFSPENYNCSLNINTPDGKINAEGTFSLQDKDDSRFNFSVNVSDLNLNRLNLTDNFRNISFSLALKADFTGNNADNALGIVKLKSMIVKTEKGKYVLDSLSVLSEKIGGERVLTANSDLFNGELRGNYNFKTLLSDINNSFAVYLPALFKPVENKVNGVGNSFSLKITVEDMQELDNVFPLPFVIREKTLITGHYNSSYNRLELKAEIPWMTIGKSVIENTDITFNNRANALFLEVGSAGVHRKKGKMPLNVLLNAKENQVDAALNWGQTENSYRGHINLMALLSRQSEKMPVETDIRIRQSSLVFNDSTWTLHPTQIKIDTAGITINRLNVTHNEQFIRIDGAIARNINKKLLVELKDVDLEYIFSSLNIPALEFGGIATGYVDVQDIYKSRKLSTHLDVKNFSFNQGLFGDLDLTGTWDAENQGVIMRGVAQIPDSSKVNIDGVIYPVGETLSINFDAERANAKFLRKYLSKIAKDIDGSFSGHLRLFGNLNDPTVEGNVLTHECRFGIDFLNTCYTFSDSVVLLPDEIRITGLRLVDEKGKYAQANGYVRHNLFSDFSFLVDVSFDDFMVYNADSKKNPTFHGIAFGTGNVRLEGTEDLINLNVSFRNTANTHMALNFMEEHDVVDYDFIRFVNSKKDSVKLKSVAAKPAIAQIMPDVKQGTEIRLYLMLDVNQQAGIDMIMDPVAGDKISGYGTGNLHIQYGDKIPLRVLGTYALNQGKYNFSLQQAIYRNFDITEGSTVSFNGDPYAADLNITANYTVQANLGDLSQQLLKQQQSAKSNIPVNCILKINGTLDRPNIAFDLNLPNSPEELNRQVKSYIRTDDILAQQFVYLLVLSRFYTSPEYMNESSQASNNMSYLTSTLSSQLSQILGALSDKFRVGAKYHQSYEGDEQTGTETELLLSSQLLDNRLLINGNFGYIDRPYLQDDNRNNVPLIGDFDLEYLLRKNGDIRLKFFNHYNYRYLNPRPEMTQGLGIQFRRDFNHIREIFKK
ncbi:MAG: translocation/assembly module TamB [Dysgonamonadaceae bacterium]|jgi:autotransporter translocation and assembly factor TamB|nr:translocation/assembly module TamB [Dysgonamonadaceae bacterium]